MKTIISNKIFDLVLRRYKLPGGKKADFYVVMHHGAVVIVPFLSKNSVIMLRQFRAAIGEYILEFPAGTLKKGENKKVCAKRELEEETGYISNKIFYLGNIHSAPGYSTERLDIFKAIDLKKGRMNLDKDEVIQAKVFTKSQILSMFKKKKITDSKTIAALVFIGWL